MPGRATLSPYLLSGSLVGSGLGPSSIRGIPVSMSCAVMPCVILWSSTLTTRAAVLFHINLSRRVYLLRLELGHELDTRFCMKQVREKGCVRK